MGKIFGAQIGCCLSIVLFNLFVGWWSIDFISNQVFNKNLPFIADLIIGVIAAELSVPIAVILWILRSCGVDIHWF